jgi:hypothetical protein
MVLRLNFLSKSQGKQSLSVLCVEITTTSLAAMDTSQTVCRSAATKAAPKRKVRTHDRAALS